MARVTVKADLPASAPRLWSLVRWDGRLLDWYPLAAAVDVDGSAKGAQRRLRLRDGTMAVHRLEHRSRIEDAYTYSVLSSPYPVADHLAQIRVLPEGDDRATLVWTAIFQPAGMPGDGAEAFIRQLYQDGFTALSALLSGNASGGADGGAGGSGTTARAGLDTAPTVNLWGDHRP